MQRFGTKGLKFYIHDHSHSFRIELHGRLTVETLPELKGCWKTAECSVANRKIQIDLRKLTGLDAAGNEWLAEMAQLSNSEFSVSAELASQVSLRGTQIIEIETSTRRASLREKLASSFGRDRVPEKPTKPAFEESPSGTLDLKAGGSEVPAS